jgi:hypothetical protein
MLRIAVLSVVGAVTGGLFLLWLTGERWRLMCRSTWISLKSQGLKNALDFKATHAYIYGRWSKQYLNVLWNWIMPRLDERGRKNYVQKHHGKVITHDQARAVITLNKNIPLRDLEQIIPYASARDLVLNGPPDVVVHECGWPPCPGAALSAYAGLHAHWEAVYGFCPGTSPEDEPPFESG